MGRWKSLAVATTIALLAAGLSVVPSVAAVVHADDSGSTVVDAQWAASEEDASGTITHAIVSESGAKNSGFNLLERPGGSSGTGGPAQMCLRTQGTSTVTTCAATATGLPLDHWSLVVGIWDAANHQIRISVDGTLASDAVTAYTVPSGDTTSTGLVLVGSGQNGASVVNEWDGLIVNPVVFPGVIDSAQLYQLHSLEPVS